MVGCEGTMTSFSFNSSLDPNMTRAEMGYLGSTNQSQQCGGGKRRSKRRSKRLKRRSKRSYRRRSTRRKRSSSRRKRSSRRRSSRRRSRKIRRLRSHLRKKHKMKGGASKKRKIDFP